MPNDGQILTDAVLENVALLALVIGQSVRLSNDRL